MAKKLKRRVLKKRDSRLEREYRKEQVRYLGEHDRREKDARYILHVAEVIATYGKYNLANSLKVTYKQTRIEEVMYDTSPFLKLLKKGNFSFEA